MIWLLIALIVIALDQVSKYIIVKNVEMGNIITVINNFFYITHHENKGAAWGILQNGRYFFITLTILVCIFIIYVLFKSDSTVLKTSLSFILGGAVGNLTDRIAKGSVTDFFEFHFGSYVYPIFNVADSFVVVGTFILAFYLLFIHKDKAQVTE